MPPNFERDEDDHPYSPHTNSYGLSSNILLRVFVSLFVVILLVVALHAYVRCVLLRRSRHRAALRQMGLTTAQVHSAEPPNTGLEPSVITSLPIFVYKININKADDDYGGLTKECAVCLCSLEDEDMVRLLPNCRHFFHAQCIDKWFSSHSTCPICRTRAEPCLQTQPREGPVSSDAPSASRLERMNTVASCKTEGTSALPMSPKVNGSSSRLSSFKIMLSRERSSRRIQPQDQDGLQDLERQ